MDLQQWKNGQGLGAVVLVLQVGRPAGAVHMYSAVDIATAVAQLHRRNVLHSDLKVGVGWGMKCGFMKSVSVGGGLLLQGTILRTRRLILVKNIGGFDYAIGIATGGVHVLHSDLKVDVGCWSLARYGLGFWRGCDRCLGCAEW
jgi:hypothetical protein